MSVEATYGNKFYEPSTNLLDHVYAEVHVACNCTPGVNILYYYLEMRIKVDYFFDNLGPAGSWDEQVKEVHGNNKVCPATITVDTGVDFSPLYIIQAQKGNATKARYSYYSKFSCGTSCAQPPGSIAQQIDGGIPYTAVFDIPA